ncbi:MAG: hypothetical protein NT007_17680 [Candidatus Kapabacteria bacterium]|nr:hypothetical protein [Candidatus Kapabacteria bacterium]
MTFSHSLNAGILIQCQSWDSCIRRNDKELTFSHILIRRNDKEFTFSHILIRRNDKEFTFSHSQRCSGTVLKRKE